MWKSHFLKLQPRLSGTDELDGKYVTPVDCHLSNHKSRPHGTYVKPQRLSHYEPFVKIHPRTTTEVIKLKQKAHLKSNILMLIKPPITGLDTKQVPGLKLLTVRCQAITWTYAVLWLILYFLTIQFDWCYFCYVAFKLILHYTNYSVSHIWWYMCRSNDTVWHFAV